ncbi:MAG: hypothetical protein E6R08_00615 [Nevskiaceae bacterium]|nr:MAG: hypothetical protein E6R08_00615 [Nevskiaceae bacterium]
MLRSFRLPALRQIPINLLVLGVLSASSLTAVAQTAAPSITYEGPTIGFPSDIIEGHISVGFPTGVTRPATTLSWSVIDSRTKAQVAVGQGEGMQFTAPTAIGGLALRAVVTVASTTPDAPPKTYTKTIPLSVVAPFKPTLVLKGLSRVAGGRESTFKAQLTMRSPLSAYAGQLTGEWIVPSSDNAIKADPKPDGSSQITLRLPVPQGDLPLSPAYNLQYRVQWAGKPDTLASGSFSTQTWNYSFPKTWSLTVVKGGNKAPAGVTLKAAAADAQVQPYLDGVTYAWSVGSSSTVATTAVPTYAGTLYNGGVDIPASVKITDRFGNTATAMTTFAIDPPDPIVTTLSATRLTKWEHAPVKVALNAKFTGVSPRDPIKSVTYNIHGDPVAGVMGRPTTIELTDTGTYPIVATARTTSGRESSATLNYIVPRPDTPVCSHTVTGPSATGVYSIVVNATSGNALISKYEWFEGATVLAAKTNKITYKPKPDVALSYVVTNSGGLTCKAFVDQVRASN